MGESIPGPVSPCARVMRSRGRPAKVIDFPLPAGEKPFKVALWIPSDEDIQRAQVDATKYLREEMKLDELNLALAEEGNLYRAEEERQILARVLRDPQNPESPWGTADELREFLDPDTRKQLFRQLNVFQDERSPALSVEDADAQIEKLKDFYEAGSLSKFLTSCDFASLVSIVISLVAASRRQTRPSSGGTSSMTSPTDTSSPIRPSDSPA